MTDNEREMLFAAFGTATAANLVLTSLIGRLISRGILSADEMAFLTDEVLRLAEQMRGGLPPEMQRGIDTALLLLPSQFAPSASGRRSSDAAPEPDAPRP